jgi:hypothetical protein
MQRPDRLIVSMFGFDALALIGLLIVLGSIAFALLDSAVFWLACIGTAVTAAAIAGRNVVVRKLRPVRPPSNYTSGSERGGSLYHR